MYLKLKIQEHLMATQKFDDLIKNMHFSKKKKKIKRKFFFN